ncbi:hypothetical protein GCM10017600_43440 [Streptosporangium carneum]|uniref:Uncharacterized protein n=1 Tax=Streptosporangium carneum TaxID=47481 RepID=A0A9W6I3D7_9ACTN|nr:hypothetical protein GCM10017600_43440 [Streptosporangium carneum]
MPLVLRPPGFSGVPRLSRGACEVVFPEGAGTFPRRSREKPEQGDFVIRGAFAGRFRGYAAVAFEARQVCSEGMFTHLKCEYRIFSQFLGLTSPVRDRAGRMKTERLTVR